MLALDTGRGAVVLNTQIHAPAVRIGLCDNGFHQFGIRQTFIAIAFEFLGQGFFAILVRHSPPPALNL